MNNNQRENSNYNKTASGEIVNIGSSKLKHDVSKFITSEQIEAVNKHHVYIHDSEYFSLSLNCLSISVKQLLTNALYFRGVKQHKAVTLDVAFSQIITAVINIENEVSGGITLCNFDQDIADWCDDVGVELNAEELRVWVKNLFYLINSLNSRANQSPYVSLSIGAITSDAGALVCDVILDVLHEGYNGKPYIFPNIQFRVHEALNGHASARYYPQFQHALRVTAKQMNPTYLLGGSEMNEGIALQDIHVVGCRSRLLTTTQGMDATGVGRTNIGVVSINLPRLGIEAKSEQALYPLLDRYIALSVDILLKKSALLKEVVADNAPTVFTNNLLFPFTSNVGDILQQASMSIGFIGGAELVNQLIPYETQVKKGELLERVLGYLHQHCLEYSILHDRVFTLIGVSGEGLSYKFAQADQAVGSNEVSSLVAQQLEKSFYTNSFHVPVDQVLPLSEKLNYEGQFHALCHGGGISYVELSHLEENIQGLEDIIRIATNCNVNYLGFNFDKNICNECDASFDDILSCPECGSDNITKIRRVSGYLGYLSSFSFGKKCEEMLRTKHTQLQLQIK
ncbi:TPA: hypothetical protein RQJ98_002316 [Vibrio vulnificus]|uniref:anaerobic ribonucleoside-triphosphate reductase n=1 Tax=Vibrio vulnificus TaxID=672 RepID=UPI0005F1AC37|nr:anaerobic ribonucleoside-triphosphate reductase [Vibrio vulnificus]MCA3914499.1 hypothetical protein [Vibrio vulnificus]MCG6313195.1 anaerobic ribonucleoside-triphosphate reductase [Vibrio vulnificus]HAS6361812.1 hypothetical protein [Vibrio vulnificus]HDY7542399.1 hypothetical protein [Vibrio vulnificus]HDY7683773.1 hypothetical protein [Vibrio vulnificus]